MSKQNHCHLWIGVTFLIVWSCCFLNANNENLPFSPVGCFKFASDSFVILTDDGTFCVKSTDNMYWNFHGTWIFKDNVLKMHSCDAKRPDVLPAIFSTPATLVRQEKDYVLWDCSGVEWQRVTPDAHN